MRPSKLKLMMKMTSVKIGGGGDDGGKWRTNKSNPVSEGEREEGRWGLSRMRKAKMEESVRQKGDGKQNKKTNRKTNRKT